VVSREKLTLDKKTLKWKNKKVDTLRRLNNLHCTIMFTHIVYVSVPIGIPIGRSFSILLLT
jgi:hypothetical protein